MKIIDVREGVWAVKHDSTDEVLTSERIVQALLIGGVEFEDAERMESALFVGLDTLARSSNRGNIIQVA